MITGAAKPAKCVGLYAITPDPAESDFERTLDQCAELIERDALAVLQYRSSLGDPLIRRTQASQLSELCSKKVSFVINDHVNLAIELGTGVHLGQQDAPFDAVRPRLAADTLSGVTCHNSLDLARRAIADGADYVAFGAYRASPTKPRAIRLSQAVLSQALSDLSVPICVIGGIRPADYQPLIAQGVNLIACISGLFSGDSAVFNQQRDQWLEAITQS